MNPVAGLEGLEKRIRGCGKALVCFSGGVDSTFLLWLCKQWLGPENLVAFSLFSQVIPAAARENCLRLARELAVPHVVTETDILTLPEMARGHRRRCYFCKKHLVQQARAEAAARGIRHIFEGSNTDDLQDDRPGFDAIREYSVRSPLLEAGLSKNQIREFSRRFGLSTWNQPAASCLITRFPYGMPVSCEALRRVDGCEAFLHSLGFSVVRVRAHGETARIEVPPPDIRRLTEEGLRRQIVTHFKQAGFVHIALDLEGYRIGSLNESPGPDRHGTRQ